jgi:ABC-type phosphate/phosphonate transport system permease subunit
MIQRFLIELATLGLIFGVIISLGALMLHFKPANKKAWGIMIMLLSIPSVVMGGGFIIGFILGIIAGKLALSGKPKSSIPTT